MIFKEYPNYSNLFPVILSYEYIYLSKIFLIICKGSCGGSGFLLSKLYSLTFSLNPIFVSQSLRICLS